MAKYLEMLLPNYAIIPENVYFTNWKSCEMDYHCHAAGGLEFNYVTGGECDYYIEDKKIHLKKRNLLIINSALPHKLSFSSENPCLILGMDCGIYPLRPGYVSLHDVMKSYTDVADFLEELDDYLIIEDGHRFYESMKEIWEEVQGEWNYAYIQSECNKLLVQISRYLKKSGNHTLEYVIKAKAYIRYHYFEIESVEDIAKNVGINKVYLQRIFKQWENQTIWNFLLQVRLEKAAVALADTDIAIGEIDSLVGIHSRQAFYHGFKKIYGMSPREYRKQSKK